MFNITREVLGMFIKPGHIPESVRDMLKLDVINECLQKSDKELHGGSLCICKHEQGMVGEKEPALGSFIVF